MRIRLAIDITIDPDTCPRGEVNELIEDFVKRDIMSSVLSPGPFFQAERKPWTQYQINHVEDLDARE